MTLKFYGKDYSLEEIKAAIKAIAGDQYVEDMYHIFNVAVVNNLHPNFKEKKADVTDLGTYLNRWVGQYLKGYNNRPSQRTGNPPTTIADSLVADIYGHLHKDATSAVVETVAKGHSLMMTIENIVGDMLEEYLAIKLRDNGWMCCWGTTIKSVDFCKADGSLLQVKTSDNSENSSSSAIRTGTSIQKWYRRKSQKQDVYCWDLLVEWTGDQTISEKDFRAFISNLIAKNPKCVYIAPTPKEAESKDEESTEKEEK